MQTLTPSSSVLVHWNVIKKEITGIQLLWEVVSGMYFQQQGQGFAKLGQDVPLFFRLTQTVYLESLLMRVARLMDPESTGKMTYLSLERLVNSDAMFSDDVSAVRNLWDGSGLRAVRDKYLSHNDLNWSLTEDHALNIPLEHVDIKALRQLADGLREMRRSVNHKLSGAAYLDEGLSIQVQRELSVLRKSLLGGEQFFKLLPDHDCLLQAWNEMEHG